MAALGIPTWRGRLHAWAFLGSIPAGLILVLAAERTAGRVATAIYVISLAAMLGTSAAYHRLARSTRARRRMRRLDHSMIFVLIAGTYTPVCLLALPLAWGIPLLVAAWAMAALGVTFKAIGVERRIALVNALYIVLGWAAIITLPAVIASMPLLALVLMVVGGVAYTLGSIVLLRRRPDPRPAVFGFHEVWHACTLVGVVSHFAMVWRIAV
ncbi:MAG: PAQR family membrane homeostasis protein TrhA [Acidimicrobiales bacterium]